MSEPLWPSAKRQTYGSTSTITSDNALASHHPHTGYGRSGLGSGPRTWVNRPLGQHRPSLGRIERSQSKHKLREHRLHRRRLHKWVLKTPCFCLIVFVAIAVFGLFCFVEEPNEKTQCTLCCFGRAVSDSGDNISLWILWLSLGIVGIIGPCFCVFACALCQRPSKRQRMKEDFYADALLEEMLVGDNVADHYDVMSVPGENSRGTVVFLGGLGAPRATAELHSRTASQAGYKTIAIDLPSHGTLSAVTYSLSRCERVILRVMQREALLEERARRRRGNYGASGGSMSGSMSGSMDRTRSESLRSETLRKDRSIGENQSVLLKPFLFSGYGPGAQSAIHFTSRHPRLVAGLFLFGPVVNLNDPGYCGCGCCSGHGCLGCGCLFGHGFGCCVNGSALIGNAPCSSIYRMRWVNYIEDALIRRRLRASEVPFDIKDRLCNEREFQVSTAIEWNYSVRHRDLIMELGDSGYDKPLRVVAGSTSADFVRAIASVVPHSSSMHMMRIGDQFLPVWKWSECNNELLTFAENEVFPQHRHEASNGGSIHNNEDQRMYIDALRRDKSANLW